MLKDLPARFHYEPIRHQHNEAQVHDLEDACLGRAPRCSVHEEDMQHVVKPRRQRVTFSEQSRMHIYLADPHYARTKSFTRDERSRFSTETLQEALRIRRQVISVPGDLSIKESFKCLLQSGVLSLEEIVGIEHLVLSNKSAAVLLKERDDHSKAVLLEQCRLKMMRKGKTEKMVYDRLGEISALSSRKSVKRARIRAAVAA